MSGDDTHLTPEQAREKWSGDHGLPAELVPLFPKGTREYAGYRDELAGERGRRHNGGGES